MYLWCPSVLYNIVQYAVITTCEWAGCPSSTHVFYAHVLHTSRLRRRFLPSFIILFGTKGTQNLGGSSKRCYRSAKCMFSVLTLPTDGHQLCVWTHVTNMYRSYRTKYHVYYLTKKVLFEFHLLREKRQATLDSCLDNRQLVATRRTNIADH